MSFNDELEIRLPEKTRALTDSLNREEKSRQILQALLHLGVELQHNDNELQTTALGELRHLYPAFAMGIMLTTGNDSPRLEHVGLDLTAADWLEHQLRTAAAGGHTLPQELRHERRLYQIFTMHSFSGRLCGVLALLTNGLDPADRDIMRLFCKQLAAIIEGRRLTEELERMASTDALTGLPNRKAFEEDLEVAAATLQRFPDRHFGLFVIDANNLKVANDEYGHISGDRLLVGIADVLRQTCRGTDVVYRLGGDEFAILVAGGSVDSCTQLAERLRLEQGHHAIDVNRGDIHTQLVMSFALGFASTEETPVPQLFREADSRMYGAKQRYYRDRPSPQSHETP